MEPNPLFERAQITIDVEERPGQPWEAAAFTVTRPSVDAAYRAQVASAFGVTGDGFVGAVPNGTAPWRLWFDTNRTLALNERTGDVLFFGPNADDGTGPSGPAVHDPGQDQVKLLTHLGTAAQFEYTLLGEFHGGDATASVERLVEGSWLEPGLRTTVAFFPSYSTTDRGNGTTIFDTDELGLFTSRGQLAQLVHRPIASVSVRAVYDINSTMLYRDAVKELKIAPSRYLRLLSLPATEPMTLHVDPGNAAIGQAWAGARQGDLTRADGMLVPVWAFYASGTTATGKPVSAVFTVDGIKPEYRIPPPPTVRNVTADSLLRTQLSVSLGGHRPGLMNVNEVVADELIGLGCAAGSYTISQADPDNVTAIVLCPSGVRLSLAMRRAFPGYERSVWYLSELRK